MVLLIMKLFLLAQFVLLDYVLSRHFLKWIDARRAMDLRLLERIESWLPYLHAYRPEDNDLLPGLPSWRVRMALRRCQRKGLIRHEPVGSFDPTYPPSWYYLWLTSKGAAKLADLRDKRIATVPIARLVSSRSAR